VFSISYDSNARLAEDIIYKTAMAHSFTITEPAEPFVRESAHNASSIDITARVWCKAENYWTLYFDLIEQVRVEFKKAGIEIPYNQLDVHVNNK
jgi:small conductance mechanosensitive channel